MLLLGLLGMGVVYATQWHPLMNLWVKFRGNATNAANYTAGYQQFIKAVTSNDYQTAEQLHKEYGFGGKLFDKLNETTFSKYSQIYTLSTELRQELGMTGQPGASLYARGFVRGFRVGRFIGAHRWQGYIKNTTNSSTTS
jgi:hypothetical protein